MTLIDIDDVAARQRLREIASANKAALDARVRQAAELAEQARQAFEREEAEHKAAQQRKAETEARAAEAQQREQRKQEQRAAEKPKFPPRPATLSLGAEEFTLARAARQAEAASPPAAPTPAVAPEPPATEERPNRTFRLGARDEQDDASKQDKPARKRPPRPEADDDMSGRTWLR